MSESKRLESLYGIARALHDQDLDVKSILQTALSMTGEAIQAKHGCVITSGLDNLVQDAYILGTSRDAETERRLWNLLINRGLIGFVHHGHRTIIVRDLTTDPRWPVLPDTPLIPRTGSAIGLPLERAGKTLGVMILIHEQVDYFDGESVEMLDAIANIASAAIGNAVEFSSTRASQAHYQWLFKDSIVPIILTDLDGQIVDVNRQTCTLLDYDYKKLTQLQINMIHRMGTGPIGTDRFASLQDGHQIEFRTSAWTSVGGEIPVVVRARRLSFGDRDLIEWVEQDISPQLELEQLRADLTAMVYHDLRGPLHTINSSFSSLGRLLINHEQMTILNLIQVGMRSTRQLSRMIEALLDIQRLEEGRAILNRKQTSLHNLLATAAELVQPLAAEANQHLQFMIDDNLPFLGVDQDMIQRVVINLLENAVKYTPDGGIITLAAGLVDYRVRISVADSGPGIPKNMHRQIFDKFSRVKYHDAPKGIGLGLAFCRLAVEAHGGQIWVESEPGSGSVFIFTLPLEGELAAV
ncbi:MAG: GAF domain-containing protein [Anaerolineae bacterium]|nr:GAF domain-containing protein [Anaerolineae bacterium]